MHLIAREGNLFDINDDPSIEDLRTITLTKLRAGASNGEDGRASPLNDAGSLAFALNFTGGGGVFVVSTIVPEPMSVTVFAGLAGVVVLRGRRRCE